MSTNNTVTIDLIQIALCIANLFLWKSAVT